MVKNKYMKTFVNLCLFKEYKFVDISTTGIAQSVAFGWVNIDIVQTLPMEIRELTDALIGLNLNILPLTRTLLVFWQHPGLMYARQNLEQVLEKRIL